jgi:FkbM family methyltransferase
MKRLLKRTFEFCALQARLRSPSIACRIHAAQGPPRDFGRTNGHIVLRDTSVQVTPANAALIARASWAMRSLAESGVVWTQISEKSFEASIRGITLEVSSAEDAFVLLEVFGLGAYALECPRQAIVIDIGANIGASSLYFAGKPWVEAIYSFEPLKPTAKIARANFARNPELNKKITLHDFGLGDRDQTLTVEYSPEWKGKSGPARLPSDLARTVRSWQEEIRIENATTVLTPIVAGAAGRAVIVKMDCEGGEWKILPELARTGVLRSIDQLLFEWHDRTPEPLEQILLKHGFSSIRRTDHINLPLGVIYASRLGA